MQTTFKNRKSANNFKWEIHDQNICRNVIKSKQVCKIAIGTIRTFFKDSRKPLKDVIQNGLYLILISGDEEVAALFRFSLVAVI